MPTVLVLLARMGLQQTQATMMRTTITLALKQQATWQHRLVGIEVNEEVQADEG